MATNSEQGLNGPELNLPFAHTWTCTDMNTIKVSHKWTINNFSLCKKKPGQFIESSQFSTEADKLKGCLKLYPNGNTEGHKDYISIYLSLVYKMHEVTTKFELSIVNAQNKKCNCREHIETRLPPFNFGCSKFIEKNTLLVDDVNTLLPNDKLTILCELTMVEDVVKTSGKSDPILPPELPDLVGDMGDFLESHKFSDITLTVNGKDIHAHKVILAARSPVFSAMFEHNMEEKKQNLVEIPDIDHEVFMEMLRFMYTAKTSQLETMANRLLSAADKYGLDTLKIMCEEALQKNLTIENAADTLILAHLHSANQLKIQVMAFIC